MNVFSELRPNQLEVGFAKVCFASQCFVTSSHLCISVSRKIKGAATNHPQPTSRNHGAPYLPHTIWAQPSPTPTTNLACARAIGYFCASSIDHQTYLLPGTSISGTKRKASLYSSVAQVHPSHCESSIDSAGASI